MKKTTRIICITLCVLLIALSAAGVIWALYNKFANNEAHAEEIEENTQTTFVNFNQIANWSTLNNEYYNFSAVDTNGYSTITLTNQNVWWARLKFTSLTFIETHKYFVKQDNDGSQTLVVFKNSTTSASDYLTISSGSSAIITGNNDFGFGYQGALANYFPLKQRIILVDLTLMFGTETANTITLQQCQQLFKADYYPYNTGTTIDLSGFEQYNAGAMSARESMTINTTSANVADNLDNVVINSSYGSSNKALIQGYMVWGTQDQYTNCTALFNLETNFNQGDYFEFEFYTITGADSISLPTISTFYDLQIVAVDSSGNIVPLANVKAQDNPNATTKATFYLPFSTDKLYITTPHKYIIGYNNFKINITTTNLTALSLYSYKDGYREGRSSGYTSGYNAGIAQQNATLGTMGYVQSAFNGIGSILQIELLPNVPFSLFILLPLMFGLIAFVVKISKGGS